MKLKEGFVLRAVGGSTVVVPVGAQSVDFRCVITLNDTGAFLWRQLQTEKDKPQLVEALLAEYEVTAAQAEAGVDAFIVSLEEAKLLA